ncbi:uncharacterized protein LOC132204598 [Neocloeon triangulifer]|uniref:uncharacterized protein LOC132204598 n=1 Tax=Neocloeon triangulifer TaxID=2078957 RepID=UPI00286F6580|nr:uncharacterized protein LOC132204598 [Neocloeon triangulifer]
MPLKEAFFGFSILYLFLVFAATPTYQGNSHNIKHDRSKKFGGSFFANSKKGSSKRWKIIKCCGANKCSDTFGPRSSKIQTRLNSTLKTNLTELGDSQSRSRTLPDQSTTKIEFSEFPISNGVPNLNEQSTDGSPLEMSPANSTDDSTEIILTKSSPTISSQSDTTRILTGTRSNSSFDLQNVEPKAESPVSSTQIRRMTESSIVTPTTTVPTTTMDPNLVGKCKLNTNTLVNRSLVATNELLEDPDQHGFWLDTCGQTLLLGKSLGTWHQNSAKCFSLIMQPLALESKEKLECMKLQAKSWKFNLNYWTGGAKDLASGIFGWCSANGSAPWQNVLPLESLEKDQNCVQMQISKTNGSISISGRRCSDRMIFACQVQFFTVMATDKSMVLKNHSAHGRLISYRLRNYLFSFENDTRTYLEATKACCALGMSLLSLNGQYKYEALGNISNSTEFKKEPLNLTFWTSGCDEGCESVFGFCTAKRLFRDEAKWLPGQPDNAGGKENYVAVHIWRNTSEVLLADYDGETKFRYICEKRRNPQSKNGKQAIMDECSVIYKVTLAEIDLLQNATTLDLRMKCFVQCVGDAAGLLVGGKFVDSEVFAMLEAMSLQNIDELIKNMAIMDECNNKTYGLDECDKAYQLSKCARDKAPEVFDQIIKDLEKQTTDSDELISKSYGCLNSLACTINVEERNNLTLINLNASEYINYTSAVMLAKCDASKTYLIRNSNHLTYRDAFKYCCERGMRLMPAESYINATSCLKVALAGQIFGTYLWTMLDVVVYDVNNGGSYYDCQTQKDLQPQNLYFKTRFKIDPYVTYSGGPQIAHVFFSGGDLVIETKGPDIQNYFICEE